MHEPTVLAEKKTRKKRGAGVLPGLAKLEKDLDKVQKDTAGIRQEARAGAEATVKREERLVKLVRVGFGGKFEGLIRNHPEYTEDDLTFFRGFGFNV